MALIKQFKASDRGTDKVLEDYLISMRELDQSVHGLTYSDVGAAASSHTHSWPTNLNDLDDVSVSTPTNNQILKYVSAQGLWVNFDAGYEPTITAGTTAQYWRGDKSWQTLNQAAVAGLTTSDSPIFATVKLSGLTDGYIPYHVADATGLANSPIYTNGTNVGIGAAAPGAKLQVHESTPLGGIAGNSQIISRFSAVVDNFFMHNEWLYRDGTGTDWATTRLHDAISVDISFLTPGTDTATWWERDPWHNIQSWGSAASTYLTINAGNVGIGTATPGARLHSYESTGLGGTVGNSQIIQRIAGFCGNNFMNNLWLYRDATGTNWLTTRLHDAISIGTSFLTPGTDTRTWWERDPLHDIQSWGNTASTYMTINAGNVGIGTATPGARLDAAGTIRSTSITTPTSGSGVEIRYSGGAGFIGAHDRTGATILPLNLYGTNLLLNPNAGGNIGIGTTNPDTKLEINAGASSGLISALKLTGGAEDVSSGPALVFQHGLYAEEWLAGKIGTISIGYGTSYKQDMVFYTNTGASGVNLSEKVRITSQGNVGIGTTTPTSKLHVVGLPAYANNAAAIAGGLTAGAFYRTGGDPDLVCVVH